MEISKATVLYLTGTGTTEKYAKAFAEALPYPTQTVSIRHDAQIPVTYGADELLVLAAPVFGGYTPAFVWEQLEGVSGSNTPCVLLAVYGARDYDDALNQMNAHLTEKGFKTVGAAALVARHSIAQTVATNRPTAEDLAQAKEYAEKTAEKLGALASIEDAPELTFKKVKLDAGAALYPVVSDECIECGVCAGECPAAAIPEDAPNTTNTEACISCLRCIEMCPTGARTLPAGMADAITQMLMGKGVNPAKANEFF